MNIEIIEVKTKEELDALYLCSALTIEGLSADEENLSLYLEALKELTTVKKNRFYVISGKLMNETYHLTNENAYPDDLTIVSMKNGEDIEVNTALCLQRFQFDGRWFDDVVDNNARKELEKR